MPSPRSARKRIHPGAPPAPGRGGQLVEHEYERKGAITYLDAWDVRRGKVMGRCEPKGGIAAFDRLVWQVMTKEPYACAPRVFWIVDNGSDHRGQRSIDRLQGRWPNLILVHTPVHGSWLNQVEIYHSIIQRKVLDPTTSTTPPPSPARSTPSSSTTTRSQSRSPGTSRAPSSPPSWIASTNPPNRRSRSPPDQHRTYGGDHYANAGL